MKTQIKRFKKALLFPVLVIAFGAVHAQDSTTLKTALETKHFLFKAQTALPTAGRMRQLTGEDYQVRVSGDSTVSYLPYFGRAYSASMTGEGGIKFTSTQFEYAVKARRKGGWDITLRPKDVSDVRELFLTVSESGNATLRATTNNRQPISYNGTVEVVQ